MNNHIVLDVETDKGCKACVIDTGSPITIFFDAVSTYVIDGMRKVFKPNPLAGMLSLRKEPIDKMVGVDVGGIIGTDLLQTGGCVRIDFPKSEIFFNDISTENPNAVKMQNLMGLPVFNVSFNGVEVKTAYDTGAMYPFATSELIEKAGLVSTGRSFEDFNPMFGSFRAMIYSGNIMIGNVDLGPVDIAGSEAYDEAAGMIGVQAFIGNSALLNHVFCISYSASQAGILCP